MSWTCCLTTLICIEFSIVFFFFLMLCRLILVRENSRTTEWNWSTFAHFEYNVGFALPCHLKEATYMTHQRNSNKTEWRRTADPWMNTIYKRSEWAYLEIALCKLELDFPLDEWMLGDIYFFNIIYFNWRLITILYWFCHTSTWIYHRSTRVGIPPFWRRQWHPTPVFLLGESQGWGRTESDTTVAT